MVKSKPVKQEVSLRVILPPMVTNRLYSETFPHEVFRTVTFSRTVPTSQDRYLYNVQRTVILQIYSFD